MINDYKTIINNELVNYFGTKGLSYDGLLEAMGYSLMAGGKRIRPILVLEFSRITGGNLDKTLPIACAIEMIHTYSLIHDDLPCMDNDDLRRGKPTNHKVFGECTATLAGDALQAEAFGTILRSDIPYKERAVCAEILASAAGVNGICGGQYLDMICEGKVLSDSELNEINKLKTGALLAAACKLGVAAANGSGLQLETAEKFGSAIGLAFQIRDDILDEISSDAELGKNTGSDKNENKKTYMAIYGQEKCEKMILQLTDYAKCTLNETFSDTGFLFSLADSLAVRLN